jgi:NTE family protein
MCFFEVRSAPLPGDAAGVDNWPGRHVLPDPSHPIIGVALSGGAARGIAHIAVLETLEQEGIPIHAIAGTSAGSIIGALYCAGMPLSKIKRIILDTKWTDVLKFIIPRRGLISSEGIYEFMEDILPVKKFSSLPFPFAAVATDLHTGEKVTITSGSVSRAVQASCSLPVVFTPTELNRKILVDGGVASQIPVRAVREALGAKKVIAVNVNYKAVELDQFDSIVKIAMHLSALWASRNAREEEKLADVVVNVNAKGMPLYDLSMAKELLKRGKKAAEEKLPLIRALL